MRTLPNPNSVGKQTRVPSRFAKRLKIFRTQSGYTQEGLAAACGMLLGHAVDNTQLSHLEHGRGYPRLPLLCALADVLGRDIDEFVEDI